MLRMEKRQKKMAARPGFEPRQTEPESVVLPLHHRAVSAAKNGSGSWIRTSDQVVNSHLLYR